MAGKHLELLMLPGLYTGDMWHLAAATVLAPSTNSTFIPITVMCISDFQDPLKCGDDFLRGSGTFKYFRSIGVPILLAKIHKANSSSSREVFAKLGNAYLQHILEVYLGAPCSSFQNTWRTTRSAPFIEKSAKNEDVNKAVVWPVEPEIYDKLIFDCSEYGPPQSGPLNLKLSTSILIQSLKELWIDGFHTLRIHLSATTDKAVTAQVAGFIKALYDTLKDKRRVILFNYRAGNVNSQHNSSLALLKSFSKIVEMHKEIEDFKIVVVDIGGLKPEDREQLPPSIDVVALYPDASVTYDKRYTAGVWASIATDRILSRRIFGVFGGRSGSMDIAAFMGVNTCSWDEPLFNPPTTDFYDGAYLSSQVNQYLRLYNQCSIQAMTLLDGQGAKPPPGAVYTNFDKQLTLNWLRGNPYARPPLAPQNMLPTVLDDALKKLEFGGTLGVKAINIP